MGSDDLAPVSKELLDQRMNQLSREFASFESDDPRRAEIVQELSRLSLISKSVNEH